MTSYLKKLEFYGVRGIALDWFKDYLSDRKQYVIFDKTESDSLKITSGVPQGSILGPLLFLIYVNDIVNVSDVLLLLLYADDTNAFLSGRNIDQMINTMNTELEKLVIWLQINKLKLNVKKTHFMIFSSGKRKFHYQNKLIMCGDEIEVVEKTKFLGVIIDTKLNWEDHISYIKKKIAKGIGIISKARKLLNKEMLKTLYHSFIYPYIDYCIEVWGSASKTRFDTIFRLQKKAIRIIMSSPFKADVLPIFQSNNILTLEEVHIYKVALFMFKV